MGRLSCATGLLDAAVCASDGQALVQGPSIKRALSRSQMGPRAPAWITTPATN